MKDRNQVKGFTLLEVIPAIALFATFSTISFNVLFLVIQMRERSDSRQYLVQSYLRVDDFWSKNGGTVAICRINDDLEWELIGFPSVAWLPDEKYSGEWICWRKTSIPDDENGKIGIEYLDSSNGRWIRWITVLELNHELEEQV